MALEKTHLVSHARLSFGGAFGSGLPCGCFQASALLPSFHTLTTCLDDGGRSPQWLAWNAASKFQFIITGIYAASCLPGLYCSIIWLPSKWWAPTSSKVDKMEVYIMSKKPSKHGNTCTLWERKFSYNMSPSLRAALWLKYWSHRALQDIKWKIWTLFVYPFLWKSFPMAHTFFFQTAAILRQSNMICKATWSSEYQIFITWRKLISQTADIHHHGKSMFVN